MAGEDGFSGFTADFTGAILVKEKTNEEKLEELKKAWSKELISESGNGLDDDKISKKTSEYEAILDKLKRIKKETSDAYLFDDDNTQKEQDFYQADQNLKATENEYDYFQKFVVVNTVFSRTKRASFDSKNSRTSLGEGVFIEPSEKELRKLGVLKENSATSELTSVPCQPLITALINSIYSSENNIKEAKPGTVLSNVSVKDLIAKFNGLAEKQER